MKTLPKLKNNQLIYLVYRIQPDRTSIPLAGFATEQRADEHCGVCAQEYKDSSIEGFLFEYRPVVFYNE